MMLPWFEPEITPSVPRAAVAWHGLDGAPPARHVRALVEAQMMALARHSRWMGVSPVSIHATGGAAANQEILQVMADVFNAGVCQFESTDSAALGAALRAWQADTALPWTDVTADFTRPVAGSLISPVQSHVTMYQALQPRYSDFERAARPAEGGPGAEQAQ
jgi:sugar (pentulose or hexulose) kinase